MRLLLFLAFAATGAGVCTAVALTEHSGEEAPAVRSIGPAGRADVFVPGILQADLPVQATAPHPPNQAAIDEKGNLVIDTSLLQLLDYFLLQPGDDGPSGLEPYLTTALSEPARQQAIDIARRYRTYMAEHDSRLAAQHADLSNLSRVRAWMEQRARLRTATIGDAAARAWYQNDDAQLQQAMFELSNAQSVPNPENALLQQEGVPHWENAQAEARHQRYLRQIVERNLLSYAVRRAAIFAE